MSSLWRATRISRWMTPTLTTVLIRPFLNLFSTNALLLMFSGLCRSHSILHPQRVSKLNDNFDILFQTRVKMYLVPSLNSSTMTMCRLCALIFALSRSGTGTGGGDIEPGIVVLVCLFQTGPQRGDVRFICETWLFLVSWQYIWSRKKCQDGFCRGT